MYSAINFGTGRFEEKKYLLMKKITKSILGILAVLAILFAATAFMISDPDPDLIKEKISQNDRISLSDLSTKNLEAGMFKTTVEFSQNRFENTPKAFYGQEIIISGNPKLDRILIGVTNNLISRVEIWNRNELIETKELGFMDKMTWGEPHTMAVDFYDQTNKRYRGKSKISMRFFRGTGFFADLGTINVDLTKYGDLSVDKSIGVFAKSIDSNRVIAPVFSDFKVWKNYKSFD